MSMMLHNALLLLESLMGSGHFNEVSATYGISICRFESCHVLELRSLHDLEKAIAMFAL